MEKATIKRVQAITNGGQLYDDFNPEIDQARRESFEKCRRYNNLIIQKNEYHPEILADYFGYFGQEIRIEPNFLTEFGFNLHLGDRVTIMHDVKIIDCAPVIIGPDVTIGPNCGLYTASHAENPILRAAHYCYEKPITIGSNVSLGASVTVCPGAKIGANTIIGAGAIVVGEIPANVVAAGNPCRVIRKIG